MTKRVIIKNGKKYIVNVVDHNDCGDLGGGGGAAAGSLVFGPNNQFLSVAANSSSFAPGTGSYTVEWFQNMVVLPNTYEVEKVIFSVGSSSVSESIGVGITIIGFNYLLSVHENDSNFYLFILPYTSSAGINNVWTHFAVVRNSSAGYLQAFQNGYALTNGGTTSQITTPFFVNANINDTSSALLVGGYGDNSTSTTFSGSITNFRFTNGYALYSGPASTDGLNLFNSSSYAFNPPSYTLNSVAGTTLLLDANPYIPYNFIDTSGLNQVVSANSVSWSMSSPFYPIL